MAPFLTLLVCGVLVHCVGSQSIQWCNDDIDCPSELYTCNDGLSICEKVPCNVDSDCPLDNAICISTESLCACKQGFSPFNRRCEKVIGRTCVEWTDCEGIEHECSYGQCQCSTWQSFIEDNGVCVSVLGQPCHITADCGSSHSVECKEHTCSCRRGYVQENSQCQQVYGKGCSTNEDCPLNNAHCRNGRCGCVDGTSRSINFYYSWICEYDLGQSCDLFTCGTNKSCNEENICSCQQGYKEVGHNCLSALDIESCEDAQLDCGSDIIYDCTDSRCQCAIGFVISPLSGTCVTEIGQTCSDVQCTGNYAACDDQNICSCITGYREHLGQCVSILGFSCKKPEDCSAYDRNAICDTFDTICKCKTGYKVIQGICTKVHGMACKDSDDCSPVSNNMLCQNDICTCISTFPVYKSNCLRMDCHVEVEPMLNLDERSPTYHTHENENALDDSKITSGWYNFGGLLLASTVDDPKQGGCGTLFPIYMKDELSINQRNALTEGQTVSTTVVVGGTDTSWTKQEFTVTMRKCSDDYHVYLDHPVPQLSAFCVEIDRPNTKNKYNLYIRQELIFNRRERNGQMFDVPHVKFTCSHHIRETTININWYVDKTLFKRPWYKDQNVLTEMELIEGNVRSFGFMLQCEIESKAQNGVILSRTMSDRLHTGSNDHWTWGWKNGKYFYMAHWSTPLGCARPVGDTSWNCTLDFDIKSEDGTSVCRKTVNDPHPKCGVSLLGVTKYGHEKIYHIFHSHGFVNYNGHYMNLGAHVRVKTTMERPAEGYLKATFGEPSITSGHALWDVYRFPDVQLQISDGSRTSALRNVLCMRSISGLELGFIKTGLLDRYVDITGTGCLLLGFLLSICVFYK